MEKVQEKVLLKSNTQIQGDYFRADFITDEIASLTMPGQFIHLHLPDFEQHVLRRPFSIYDVDPDTGRLSIIYKVVGEGTAHLSNLKEGKYFDILGPLGTPFSPLPANSVIVAGGYGCAATFMAAKLAENKPDVIIGGRSKGDILLKDEYEKLGCRVHVSTDDGSYGLKGQVTDVLAKLIPSKPWIISCGPIPMLKALAEIMNAEGLKGELSMDKAMCCGVGACFACVTKVKADNEDGWRYARICQEGPVFPADTLLFD